MTKIKIISGIIISGFILGGVLYFYFKENPIQSPNNNLGAVCQEDISKSRDQRIKECPITGKERATFKGKEIANLLPTLSRTNIGDYLVEIVLTRPIEGGVEMLARAWQNGIQIGFGKDGTVDLEKFVFINPPILVADNNGTIVREWNDKLTGQLQREKYREDPKEAILRSLNHTIKVKKQKFGSQNIIAGKIGNTTLTAYPQPSTGTAPIDGQTQVTDANTTFATIQAAAGTSVDNTSCCIDTYLSSSATTDQFSGLYRAGFGFDTSSIGTNDVDSSSIFFYGRSGSGQGLGDTNGVVVDFNPVDGSLFAAGDHANYGTTLYSDTQIAISAISTTAYNEFPLNATGLTNINKTGNSYYGRRLKWDNDGGTGFTGTWASVASSNWQSWGADDAGTTRDPKLVVEHTAVAAAAVGEEYIIIFSE